MDKLKTHTWAVFLLFCWNSILYLFIFISKFEQISSSIGACKKVTVETVILIIIVIICDSLLSSKALGYNNYCPRLKIIIFWLWICELRMHYTIPKTLCLLL